MTNVRNEAINKESRMYLLVVDESAEFAMAVDYACRFAKASGGRVALLSVMDMGQVENWQNIENRIRQEMRADAEKKIWDVAKRVIENMGKISTVFIEEGDKVDVILKILADNPNIESLILGGAINTKNPGPLVTYFSGKGLSRLPVPLIVVPGNLPPPKSEES